MNKTVRKIFCKLENLVKKFFLINDNPHKIAAGAALGFFLGTIPGEGVLSTMLLSSLLKFNRLAALTGVLATNMWMTVVVLPPAAYVGGMIFGVSPAMLKADFQTTMNSGINYFFSKVLLLELILPLMVGFVAVAGSMALVIYGALYYQLKKRNLHLSDDQIVKKLGKNKC